MYHASILRILAWFYKPLPPRRPPFFSLTAYLSLPFFLPYPRTSPPPRRLPFSLFICDETSPPTKPSTPPPHPSIYTSSSSPALLAVYPYSPNLLDGMTLDLSLPDVYAFLLPLSRIRRVLSCPPPPSPPPPPPLDSDTLFTLPHATFFALVVIPRAATLH